MIHNINYQEFAQVIREKREQVPELKNLSDREIISHVLQTHTGALTQTNIPFPQTQQGATQSSTLPDYASLSDSQTKEKIESLISLTLEKGISVGVSEVKGQDPYLIDLYHDAMVDKLFDEMKKRNLI